MVLLAEIRMKISKKLMDYSSNIHCFLAFFFYLLNVKLYRIQYSGAKELYAYKNRYIYIFNLRKSTSAVHDMTPS